MAELTLPQRSALTRSVLAALAGFVLFCLYSPAPARARQRGRQNQPATGRIEISTSPGGYPVFVDGRPAGETTESARILELEPGRHTVEVAFPGDSRWSQTFNLAAGRKRCVSLNYHPTTVSIPAVTTSPCPYPVNVSAPAGVNDGDVITFSADVGYIGQSALNYTWDVSPPSARVLSGEGTPTIAVDSSGLGGRRVAATLVVDDGSRDRGCRQTARAYTKVLAPPKLPASPRRFDEFPSVAFDDVKARLDLFAIELQNSPGATGYVIAYAGRAARPGRGLAPGARAKNYLVNARGISASRLVVLDGGRRGRAHYELWLAPPGAPPPRPSTPAAPPPVAPGASGQISPAPAEPDGPRGGEAAILSASFASLPPAPPPQGAAETIELGYVSGTVTDCGEAPASPQQKKKRGRKIGLIPLP